MRQELLLNEGWVFKKGEVPRIKENGHFDTYMNSKAQCGRGEADPLFYDGDFETVKIPHDYVLTGSPSETANDSNGSYHRENAWYRRHFKMPCAVANKRVILYFEGAGQKTTVWVNGHFATSNDSMYNSFYTDITPYLNDGEAVNTLAVHIENTKVEGWWYEGAGIYRNVHLIITDEISVDHWGIWVNPKKVDEQTWSVPVESTIYSILNDSKKAIVKHSIIDPCSNVVASCEKEFDINPEYNTVMQELTVKNPSLWDIENPNLYTVKTEITVDGNKLDQVNTNFGFRTIRFDSKTGFYLNDKFVKLHGGCLHQDHGNIGVAVPDSVFEYRVREMKKCGFNSIRFAHNNPAPGSITVCDRLGVLAMDENRWFNWSDRTKTEVINMVKRDRNSPSVFVWSVGNEEPLQSTPIGAALVRNLRRLIRSYDDTRPITIALNGGFYDSHAAKESDVVGVNYFLQGYDKFPEAHPNKLIMATESGATGGSRAVYFDDEYNTGSGAKHGTIYDERKASFGSAYRDAIVAAATHPYVAGTYVWTAIEYRGEASWPGLFSCSGVLDNCGFRKDNFYMFKSLWCKDEPMIHILPHWSHEGREGQIVKVQTYTNCEEAELFLNGKSLGRQTVVDSKDPTWEVAYEKGIISAIGYNGGREIVKAEHSTVSAPAKLCLDIEDKVAVNTGEDTIIVNAHMEDSEGRILPTASYRVRFTCENASLLCVSGGDTLEHEDPRLDSKPMFKGRIQSILRPHADVKSIKVTAICEELGMETSAEIAIKEVEQIAKLEICDQKLSINTFRIWPQEDSVEAVTKEYNFDDMNSSEPVRLPQAKSASGEGAIVYTAKSIVPLCNDTLSIKFIGLQGTGKLRVFHQIGDCWPNPTPAKTMDYIKEFDCTEKTDVSVVLDGFSANEKTKIVISADSSKDFSVEDVIFSK